MQIKRVHFAEEFNEVRFRMHARATIRGQHNDCRSSLDPSPSLSLTGSSPIRRTIC